MFGVPGPLGAKLGNFELGGGATKKTKFPNLAPNRPGTPKIKFLVCFS